MPFFKLRRHFSKFSLYYWN